MTIYLKAIACSLMLFSSSLLAAQDFPLKKDVSTIDGIMKAYYEVVSRKAGEPMQTARDLSLHIPQAQVIILKRDDEGYTQMTRMTIDDFHDPAGKVSDVGFIEYEISRKERYHGENAHIWSTYQTRETKDGPVVAEGINSIQLYNDGRRWWIVAEMWDATPFALIEQDYYPDDIMTNPKYNDPS